MANINYEIGSKEWENKMDQKAEAFFRTITGQAQEGDQEVADEVAETMRRAVEIMQ